MCGSDCSRGTHRMDALNGIPWSTGASTIAAVLILNRYLMERATYFTPGAAVLLGAVAVHGSRPRRWSRQLRSRALLHS